MPRKAGLDLALDFTKFIIALDGALIAFLTGASFLQTLNGAGQRGVVILTLCALGISMIAGILVYMRTATMASEGKYDLGDPHLRWPGVVNVLFFLIGAFALGSLTLFQVGATSASTKKGGTVDCRQLECTRLQLRTASTATNEASEMPITPITTPTNIAAALAAINVAAFAAFGIDKARAESGVWRVQESTLLLLALLGGTVGAYAGRALFRHKTRKQPFSRNLLAVLVLQLAGLGAWLGWPLL